jgi:hypothetical protein
MKSCGQAPQDFENEGNHGLAGYDGLLVQQ